MRFTVEHATNLQIATDVQLAPDGRYVLFNVAPIGHAETNPTSQIWLAEPGQEACARPFTTTHADNRMARWSPDGSAIAFLSDRAERGTTQLHLVPIDGGEPRQLTNVPRGLDLIQWQPDGSSITGTADRRALAGEQPVPDDYTVHSLTPRPRVIVCIGPDSRTAPRVVGPAEGHVWAYAWRPDGQEIAALVTDTDALDDIGDIRLILLDPITRQERVVTRFAVQPDMLAWSPDSNRIALLGDAGRAMDDTAVMVINAVSGEIDIIDMGESTPIWLSWLDANTLVTASHVGLYARIDQVHLDTMTAEPLDLLPSGSSTKDPLSLSTDKSTIAMIRTSTEWPPEVWAGPINGGALTRLSNLNPQLKGVQIAPQKPISWTAGDGLTIEGWLITPPDAKPGQRLPLIADIHGGPVAVWTASFHGTWHDWGQLLAAAGFAVLVPNPRGSTGRGPAFTAANFSDIGGMDLDDTMRGIDMLIEQGIADPDRLGIAGWSYGGFITAWAIAHSSRFKAAVCGAAVTNWPSKIGTTDIRPVNDRRLASPIHENPDVAWELSPIRYLKNISTPTLVVHGEADPRVPHSQGLELYSGLKQIGVPTDFITYPRQAHAFHEKAHQRDVARRIVGWFRRWL